MKKIYTVEQLERLLECAEKVELIISTDYRFKELNTYIFGNAAPEQI